jgi:hypothetical protein
MNSPRNLVEVPRIRTLNWDGLRSHSFGPEKSKQADESINSSNGDAVHDGLSVLTAVDSSTHGKWCVECSTDKGKRVVERFCSDLADGLARASGNHDTDS